MSEIVIPFCPRFPQTVILPELNKRRFSSVVLHRRAGKTVMLINHTIRKALECDLWEPRYAYIAPFLKQAKLTTWTYWKYYTSTIPGRTVNESELYVELPGGRRIYLFGADNPDAIRGPYWDGTIQDEYSQIKPNVYNEIIRPALADRKGWTVFSGTPKGQNQFYDVHCMAEQKMREGDPKWFSCLYRADETGAIDAEELELMRQTIPDSTYRQEMLCDFTASADNVLITIDIVTEATRRNINQQMIDGSIIVMGVDCARYGDDNSCIVIREGIAMRQPIIMTQLDLMELVGRITKTYDEVKPDACFIDEGGLGAGVVDRLKQLGYKVIGVNFGSKATAEARYNNKRTEMWDITREWLETAIIPNNPELKTDLIGPTYSYDPSNRMRLESKEDMKKRGVKSPDIADALALTFAHPVKRRGEGRTIQVQAVTRYNPYNRR